MVTTQAEVDALAGLENIECGLWVEGHMITDLAPLSSLTFFGPELSVVGTSLTSLHGLENIRTHEHSSIVVARNSSLGSLAGLGAVDRLQPGLVNLEDLPLVSDLSPLAWLTSGTLSIERLDLVTSLVSLGELPGATLEINLLEMLGLASVSLQTTGEIALHINVAPALTALDSGTVAGTSLSLVDVPGITELTDGDMPLPGSRHLSLRRTGVERVVLTSIGQMPGPSLAINENPSLSVFELPNFSGARKPDTLFQFTNNPLLPRCVVDELLAIMEPSNDGTVIISGLDDDAICEGASGDP